MTAPFPTSVFEAFKQSPTAREDLVEWLTMLRLDYEAQALDHVAKGDFTGAAAAVAGSRAIALIVTQITAPAREEVAQHEYIRQTRPR